MEHEYVQPPVEQSQPPAPVPWYLRQILVRNLFKRLWRRLNKRQKKAIKIVAICLAAITAVQLIYPRNRTLPNTQILGQTYIFKSRDSVASNIIEVSDAKITVNIGNAAKVNTDLASMGLEIDGQTTVQPALNYSWPARFVPFSLLWRRNVSDFGVASKNPAKTKVWLTTLEKYNKAAVDASAKVEGMTILVVPGKDGYSYSNGDVQASLTKLRISTDYNLNLMSSVQRPAVSDAAAQKAVDAARARLEHKLAVSIDNQVVTVDKAALAAWMTFTPNDPARTLDLSYDPAKIKTWLNPYAKKVYVAQVPKQVTTLDGSVTGQVPGKSGRAMQLDKSASAIIDAANTDKELAAAVVLPVDPSTKEIASYTRSSKGIQALINSWVKSHSGSYYVAMRTTSGDVSASYNASTKVVPASIYKLYVADVIYTQADQGKINLNDTAMPGKSIKTCLELMIVRSDNPCAHALGDKIGWADNDAFLHGQGFGSTSLGPLGTTAGNTMNYLLKLQAGTLINASYSSTLLGYMRKQIYRGGIPTGSDGAVADKVGFIDELNHDAAIVYHPSGTYALVIMTRNSSFSNIADLSRRISNVMSQ